MGLKEYLDLIGKKQKDFAVELGVSGAHVSDLVKGKKKPSPDLATKIEDLTNGEVKASDLLQHLVPDGYRLVKEEKEAA